MTNKDLAELNAAFAALSPEQQRVAIAIDTIQQLWLGVFRATSGTYLELTSPETFKVNQELQEVLTAEGIICEVCARGAIFASAVRKSNAAMVCSYDAGNTTLEMGPSIPIFSRKELAFFSRDQLELMEGAFEMWEKEGTLDDDLARAATRFGRYFFDEDERLMAIMQNVIDNNGTFCPQQVTKPLNKEAFFAKYPL
jgi:hypothetical protein